MFLLAKLYSQLNLIVFAIIISVQMAYRLVYYQSENYVQILNNLIKGIIPFFGVVLGKFPPAYFPSWSIPTLGQFPARHFPPGHFPPQVNSYLCQFPPGHFPLRYFINDWVIIMCPYPIQYTFRMVLGKAWIRA